MKLQELNKEELATVNGGCISAFFRIQAHISITGIGPDGSTSTTNASADTGNNTVQSGHPQESAAGDPSY